MRAAPGDCARTARASSRRPATSATASRSASVSATAPRPPAPRRSRRSRAGARARTPSSCRRRARPRRRRAPGESARRRSAVCAPPRGAASRPSGAHSDPRRRRGAQRALRRPHIPSRGIGAGPSEIPPQGLVYSMWAKDGIYSGTPGSSPLTFALARRRSSCWLHTVPGVSREPVHLNDHLELLLERQPCELAAASELRRSNAIERFLRAQPLSGGLRGTSSSGLRAHASSG